MLHGKKNRFVYRMNHCAHMALGFLVIGVVLDVACDGFSMCMAGTQSVPPVTGAARLEQSGEKSTSPKAISVAAYATNASGRSAVAISPAGSTTVRTESHASNSGSDEDAVIDAAITRTVKTGVTNGSALPRVGSTRSAPVGSGGVDRGVTEERATVRKPVTNLAGAVTSTSVVRQSSSRASVGLITNRVPVSAAVPAATNGVVLARAVAGDARKESSSSSGASELGVAQGAGLANEEYRTRTLSQEEESVFTNLIFEQKTYLDDLNTLTRLVNRKQDELGQINAKLGSEYGIDPAKSYHFDGTTRTIYALPGIGEGSNRVDVADAGPFPARSGTETEGATRRVVHRVLDTEVEQREFAQLVLSKKAATRDVETFESSIAATSRKHQAIRKALKDLFGVRQDRNYHYDRGSRTLSEMRDRAAE